MAGIKLQILSPEAILVEEEVDRVFLPGIVCPFEVLKDHAPMVTALSKGKIRYGSAEELKELEISSGFVEVKDNAVSVCVEI